MRCTPPCLSWGIKWRPGGREGQEQRTSQQRKGFRTVAVQSRSSAADPEISWAFSASAEGNARGPSGRKPHKKTEPPQENIDPRQFSWAEVRASPSATFTRGKGAVPSRRDVIFAVFAALNPVVLDPIGSRQQSRQASVCLLDAKRPSPPSYASGDCDGDSDLMLQKNKSVEQEMPSPLGLVRVVKFQVVSLNTEMRRRWKYYTSKVSSDLFTKSFFCSLFTQCWFARCSSVSGLRRPALRLAELAHEQLVSQSFTMLKPHFTLLDELAFSKIVLILTPASVLSALEMSTGNDACSP